MKFSVQYRGVLTAPIIGTVIIMATKAVCIGRLPQPLSWWIIALAAAWNDLPFLGFVSFFCMVRSVLSMRWIAVIAEVLGTLGMFWYMIDTIVVLALNSRVPFVELITYSLELGEVRELSALAGLILLCFASIFFLRRFTLTVHSIELCLLISFVSMLAPIYEPIKGLALYSTPIFVNRHERNFIASTAPAFSPQELSELRAEHPLFDDTPIDLQGRNVILDVVESLSTVDSKATGGIHNYLPRYDELSRQGTLFVNFFANYSNSEGGLISLLNGIPPMDYPHDGWTMNSSFTKQDSIIRVYKKSGYDAIFLAASTLGFRNKGSLMTSIGFFPVFGRESLASLESAPRYSFGSPTDEVVYGEALKITRNAQERGRPFLLTIETTSSHLPYVDPLGRDNSEENVWRYVDSQIATLYQHLSEIGFFKHGVLIITGDHHKMIALEPAEVDRFQDSAPARISLLIIGDGIPSGKVDSRYYQQSDLLKMLPKVSDSEAVLSPYVTHVLPHATTLVGANPETSLILFANDRPNFGFQLQTHGKDMKWLGDRPNDYATVESDRKRILSRLQYVRDNSK